jgi:hypothetical protein
MSLLKSVVSNPLGTTEAVETNGNASTVNQIDDSAGTIYTVEGSNPGGQDVFLKLYQGISSAPTVGQTAPDHIFRITAGGGLGVSYPGGLAYTTGLYAAVVQGSGGTEGTTDPESAVTYKIRFTT